MKKILAILLFAFVTIGLNAQYGVDNILRKYKNDPGVIAWQFQGDLSSFLNRKDGESIKSSVESVEFIMFNKGKNISDKDQDKLKERIQGDNYEMLVQARDKGKKIEIHGIEDGEIIKKVFAQVKSDEYNIYFFLTGEIYFEDMSELNIDGLMNGMNID
ncbi:MAG: DUF4252 domain-containing protein [Saprospiraceae bacterium]|nr:DUF4252 domain-containing protein [Saprospiraceae bacterium]